MPRDVLSAAASTAAPPRPALRAGMVQRLTQKLKTLRIGDVAFRRNPLFYSRARALLRTLEEADLAERRAWTRARLAQALAAAANLGYARSVRVFHEAGAWPLLDRTQVRGAPGAFRGATLFPAARASTGGTSGAPLSLARSLRSVVFEQACIDHAMALLGVSAAGARIAVLRGDNVKDPSDLRPPFWTEVAGGRRLVLSSNHLSAATVGHYADALERFAPDVLWAYPTSLESLCVHLRRAGRALALPRVLTSSEVLRAEVWHFVARTLGCDIVDYYGQAERVAFAYARSPGEYRFLPGYSHVELVPAGESGAALYEVVGTTLWNGAMPLVRYRTGDLVPLAPGMREEDLEAIALGIRPFPGILGRDTDILISPDGVRLTGIDHFQRDIEHLVRIQVIQESATEVRILVLPAETFGDADEAQLLVNARTKVPASMHVTIERVETLEKTALGKTPFVIHRPAVKALLAQGGVGRAPGPAEDRSP